jgi:acyl carrier protein
LALGYEALCDRIILFIREEVKDKSVDITMDTPIESIKMDSIDVIHVVFRAEEEFRVAIDLDMTAEYVTIGDLVRPIIERIMAKERS